MSKKILINIEVTSYCYANCVMCPREEIHDFGYIVPETIDTILSQIDSNFVREISLSGRGEPLLHRQLPAVLERLKNPPAPTALVTTGTYLSPAIIEALDKYIDKIRLSVSSFDPIIFSQVHRGLQYQNVWKNISFLAKRFPKKVVCHLVGGPIIYNSLPQTVGQLRSLGLTELFLFPLWNRAGLIETKQIKEKRLSLLEELNIPPSEKEYSNGDETTFWNDYETFSKTNEKYCPIGDSSISISYSGDILGCFQDFGHKTILDNISQTTLKAVYLSRKNTLGNMSICESCNAKKEALLCH